MRVARCIPPEKMDWSYAPGRFTLGDLLRHIAATERYMFAENVQGRASRYISHGKEFAGGRDHVLAFMERLHAETMEIFAKLSDQDLQGKCRNVGGTDITVWEIAALHDGTRNSSSGTDLSLPWDSGSADPAALRVDIGGSTGAQRRLAEAACLTQELRSFAPKPGARACAGRLRMTTCSSRGS